jgi:hypothetical protein
MHRRRARSIGTRRIAVAGVGGGAGATAIAAAVWTGLLERTGSRAGVADHVGGDLIARLPPSPVDSGSPLLVSDLGPHAGAGHELLSRAGDVVVVVAPFTVEGARRGADARHAILEARDDDGALVVLVLVETHRVSRAVAQRVAASATGTGTAAGTGPIVFRWDDALAQGRGIEPERLSASTTAALGSLLDIVMG